MSEKHPWLTHRLVKTALEYTALGFTIMSCVCGALLYVTAIASKADLAVAAAKTTEERVSRQGVYFTSFMESQEQTNRILLDRTARIEAKQDLLLRK